MRVLLAARHPPQGRLAIGGVQSWTATVANELHRRGIMVECWGPEFPVPAGRFDLGIFANVSDTAKVLTICSRVLTVCHGIIPAEKPLSDYRCVYTSEGVRDHWQGDGPVVRQPVDLSFWCPEPSEEPAALVRYSYYRGLPFLPVVAGQMDVPFRHVMDAPHAQAREILRSAICVLASGRAAIEAAACGAAVVVIDHRSAYQGPLMAPFGAEQMAQNYSGRGGVVPDTETVYRAIQEAIANRDVALAHVQEHHDAGKVVEALMAAAA